MVVKSLATGNMNLHRFTILLFKIAAVMIVVAMAVSLMCSCASHKDINDVAYKDSVRIRDSVVVINKTAVKDSVVCRDSVVQIVNQNGDVVGHDSWHWREKTSAKSDTVYINKQSFVTKYKTMTIRKTVYKKQKESSWSRTIKYFGYAFIIVIIVVIGYFTVRFYRTHLGFSFFHS